MVEAKKEGYTISNIYQGGYSSLDPDKGYGNLFSGYGVTAGSLGLTTDPRNANFLQEVTSKLSTGVKQIEVEGLSPEIFESVPKQHLKELNRLSKLTGIDISVHGPTIEPSGVTQQGFSEANREAAERQMNLAVERSHEINPDGSSPVTFHSSVILPGEIKPKGQKEVKEILIIDPETNNIKRIPITQKKFPGEEEVNVKKEVDRINEESWRSALTHLAYNTERAGQYIGDSHYLQIAKEAEEKQGKKAPEELKHSTTLFNVGTAFLQDSYREFKELYNIAYKNAENSDKKIIEKLGDDIREKVEKINQDPKSYTSIALRKQIVEDGLDTLNKLNYIPQTFKPLNEFAKDRTTTTFANIALNSYKKFKDKAPIISIENPPAGGAFSTGEELRQIIEDSRKKFIETAKKEGISEGEARKQSERLIGATLDVGHMNMLRKYGYEEKDIVKESEELKPLLKNIHLSDNFGFEHTELPMGMGNVPIKEIMKKLGKEGYDVKKIIEAGNWWQHFKTAPVQETLEAFGSPMYSALGAPYWNQVPGFQQGYYSGLGLTLPQINYQTFGGGFSQLPTELGGQQQGAQGSRMSGKPME